MDTDALGPRGEEFAWALLKKRGDKLVARNYACPFGELDLVTWSGPTLVFTEVRARSGLSFGTPAQTVSRSKQQRVKRAAEHFLSRTYGGRALPPCRFDVVWLLQKDGQIAESGIIEGAFV